MPAPKNLIELLMSAGQDDEPGTVGLPRTGTIGASTPSLADLAAPYLRQLDPQRVNAVRAALQRLDMLQREGVLLTTPEIVFPN